MLYLGCYDVSFKIIQNIFKSDVILTLWNLFTIEYINFLIYLFPLFKDSSIFFKTIEFANDI